MCFLLCGFPRVVVCCDWVHATHKLYSDFSFHCCLQGVAVVVVSMWVVDLCISAHVGSFISSCFSNVGGSHHEHIMLLCVFHFRVRASCSRHGVCPCVNICWRREESLCLNSFALTNFQNTWCSCFLLVWMIIRHIPQSALVSERS